MTRVFTTWAGVLLLLFLPSAGAGADPGKSASATPGPVAPPKAETHDRWWHGYTTRARRVRLADGRHLTLFCEGRGTPAVVLEIGLGGGAWGWSTVQDDMARHTRVCSYDRAGYSDSDPATGARSFDALAADLDALLVAARIPGPYVMVGQSLGGPIVGLFAR